MSKECVLFSVGDQDYGYRDIPVNYIVQRTDGTIHPQRDATVMENKINSKG